MRREVDEAMRTTSEQLSQVTNLLALVTAPPIETATIHRVEVLLLQPQVAMVVIITSTGGVTKRIISYDTPVDPGLVDWASSYLNEALGGLDVGSRMLQSRLAVEGRAEQQFLATLAPAFTELEDSAGSTLFMEGAARLLSEHRLDELSQIGALMEVLEHRRALLGVLRESLATSAPSPSSGRSAWTIRARSSPSVRPPPSCPASSPRCTTNEARPVRGARRRA
jgi:heat-inducible transcriptional repressor